MKAGQVALRCFLGCGNAMGLEFEDDASYYLRLDITTLAVHLASPLYIIFHYSNPLMPLSSILMKLCRLRHDAAWMLQPGCSR